MGDNDTSDHLRVLLYKGTGSETVSLGDYLDQYREGFADWAPDLGFVGLDLSIDGQSFWSWRVPIGDLARVVFQIEAALRRIAEDEPALIRIAVDDAPEGRYFSLRPDGDTVYLSLIDVEDPDIAFRYPVDRDGNPVVEVYRAIAPLVEGGDSANGAAAGEQIGGQPNLRHTPYPRAGLEAELRRAADQGRQLYELLGEEFSLELY